ncbi:uncharacterized protein BDV17DRAFT_82387 [Aspergillus undulatus]|uniref:uncharacterized protein n=1 Tax=Aspergillus undulatus TaxID=1810928 RepID=UPI003CCD0AD9
MSCHIFVTSRVLSIERCVPWFTRHQTRPAPAKMTRAEVVPRKTSHKVKARVKSGCRTCKIRKVKCDEAYQSVPDVTLPAVSAMAMAYEVVATNIGTMGLWMAHATCATSLHSPVYPLSLLAQTTWHPLTGFGVERSSSCRAHTCSDFWAKTILQVSNSEQAVWQAVMALSSTHRVGFVEANSDLASRLEQTTLRHLIKAANFLQPHFSAQDKTSARIVLIICLVFIVLDLLRGHFVSAQLYLRNGLRILETQSAIRFKRCESQDFLHPTGQSIDDSIGEAFFRLHTQVELLQHQQRPCSCILPPPIQLPLHGEISPDPLFLSYTPA